MIVILLSFGKSGNLDWVSILIDLETGICMDDRIEITNPTSLLSAREYTPLKCGSSQC